jgi:hypothetical protein
MDMVALCSVWRCSARRADLFQLSMSQVMVENLEGIPLLGPARTRMTPPG